MSDRIKYGESIGMGSTPTSPQPTHVAPSTGAISDRPEWASGPEWEAWKFPAYSSKSGMTWRELGTLQMVIQSSGALELYDLTKPHGATFIIIQCLSPDHALKSANAIAEAAGGWA